MSYLMDDEEYFDHLRGRVFALFLVAAWLVLETWGNP